jgi:putative transposase
MVTPALRREAVTHLQTQHGFSQRRACQVTASNRASIRYRGRRSPDVLVRDRLRQLARERPRFGYQRLHVLLRREGHRIKHKKTYRLYCEEGLKLRQKGRRRRAGGRGSDCTVAQGVASIWSLDFVHDQLGNGRRFRVLSVVDEYTRECVAMEVDTSLPGARVVQLLERLRETRGIPHALRMDNGPEFSGRAVDAWACEHDVKLLFIDPGKPMQNPYIESFNGRLRDECLNQHWFLTLVDARCRIEGWRQDYNEVRPHSALGNQPPAQFADQLPKTKERSTGMV